MSAGSGVDWHPKKFIRDIETEAGHKLDKAAIALQGHVVKSFGSSGVTGRRSGATAKDRAGNRSRPGEIPHVDTGALRASIGWDSPDKLSRRIGPIGQRLYESGGRVTVSDVGFWLEIGTRLMEARPFLGPGLNAMRSMIARILTT